MSSIGLSDLQAWTDFYAHHKTDVDQLILHQPQSGHIDPRGGVKKPCEVNNELNGKVCVWKGDITTLQVDAIVNAAKRNLRGGDGVDGAIHKKAGALLKKEAMTKETRKQM